MLATARTGWRSGDDARKVDAFESFRKWNYTTMAAVLLNSRRESKRKSRQMEEDACWESGWISMIFLVDSPSTQFAGNSSLFGKKFDNF